jgi:hypothetical protein
MLALNSNARLSYHPICKSMSIYLCVTLCLFSQGARRGERASKAGCKPNAGPATRPTDNPDSPNPSNQSTASNYLGPTQAGCAADRARATCSYRTAAGNSDTRAAGPCCLLCRATRPACTKGLLACILLKHRTKSCSLSSRTCPRGVRRRQSCAKRCRSSEN